MEQLHHGAIFIGWLLSDSLDGTQGIYEGLAGLIIAMLTQG